MVGRWSLVIGRLPFVVREALGVALVILLSMGDLISLTSNWHFADLRERWFVKLRGKSKRF
jgi:hypothetical protein